MFKTARLLLACAVVSATVAFNAPPAQAATLTVTTTNDSGIGSLRNAIETANATTTPDTINFAIPGSGVRTIALVSALPVITQPIVIDGYSQTGSQPNTLTVGSNALPLIELRGGVGMIGLQLSGGGSTVRGLILNSFGGSGSAIKLDTLGGNTIAGNFIGTNAAGNAIAPTYNGVGVVVASASNTIGGTAPQDRNLLSANLRGVRIDAGAASNTIQGNYMGTDKTGMAALGNLGEGIEILFAPNNLIGGTAVGAGNVISGNGSGATQGAIRIFGSDARNNLIQGNYIGTNADGTAAIANNTDGIRILQANNNIVGGTATGAGNLISGNTGHGIHLASIMSATQIQGNKIGTDVTGKLDLGNGDSGVYVETAGSVIGGTAAGARNVIAGNDGRGIYLNGPGATTTTVQGNLIGLNVLETKLPNSMEGVRIENAPNNTIGGTSTTAANFIGGNGGDGIALFGTTSGTKIQGNAIGTLINVSQLLGNDRHGIYLANGASNTTIGGTATGAANRIAYNGGSGIVLAPTVGTGNLISRNAIYSNVGMGIDLGGDGVTANDAGDGDTGPNNLQNTPVFTAAGTDGTTTMVGMTMVGAPNTTYQIELFSQGTCDSSGSGEGFFLRSIMQMTTGANGQAVTTYYNPNIKQGQVLTATATDPANNTSEFSPCITVAATGSFQFSAARYDVNENNGGATVTVTRSSGTGAASVSYATTNGDALAPADYTATSGTLTFAEGETSKTFSVQIADDALDEEDESLDLRLNNPTGGLILGSQREAQLYIVDDESPTILIDDITVREVSNGTTTATYTIKLSSTTTQEVYLDYYSEDDTAEAGVDYEGFEGSLTFEPGKTTKTIELAIIGDDVDEPDETFELWFFNAENARLSRERAVITINDDEVVRHTVFVPMIAR